MKNHWHSVLRLSFFPGVAAVLICSFGYSLAAQSLSPSGSYGFVAGVSQIDSAGNNGGAILGVANFDGAGNVSGNAIIQPRGTTPQNSQSIPSTFTGSYSSNPDGTGSLTINLDIGFSITLAMVTTDGGQGFQLAGTAGCSLCGADVPLRMQGTSLTGALPIGLLLQGAMGTIPLSLSNVTKDFGGPTPIVYMATPAAGSGTAQCPDGSTGNWTGAVPALTVVVNGGLGNFLAAADGVICGQPDFETVSGLVYPAPGPGGANNLILHVISGGVGNGVARVARGGSLNGSYGFQFNYSPFPAGSVGVMNFDGAGNVTVSVMNVGGTLTSPNTVPFTGRYSVNTDGSGTINLTAASGQSAGAISFVITDGGSQLLLLRTNVNPGFNVAYGTARAQ